MRVGGGRRVYAIADEDMDRENAEKTSSVHFLRFEFDDAQTLALRQGTPLQVGVDHPNYSGIVTLSDSAREELLHDFA